MSSCKHAVVAIACTLAATMSHATPTVDVTFDRNIFEGSGYDNVVISASGGNGIWVSAGRFQGIATNVVGVSESIFVDDLKNLFMYCYDIFQEIRGGASATYSINLNGEMARTLDFLGAVNAVMNQGKAVYDPFAWLHPVSGYQGAAIQLGIWESKYESDAAWNLNGGSFKATDLAIGQGQTLDWWNKFSAATGQSASLDGDYVMVLENSRVQDMITGDPPSVPEPASLALMGLGFAGLFWARRRKASMLA